MGERGWEKGERGERRREGAGERREGGERKKVPPVHPLNKDSQPCKYLYINCINMDIKPTSSKVTSREKWHLTNINKICFWEEDYMVDAGNPPCWDRIQIMQIWQKKSPKFIKHKIYMCVSKITLQFYFNTHLTHHFYSFIILASTIFYYRKCMQQGSTDMVTRK